MPFQSMINAGPARAQGGDFASANPRAAVLAGPGGLIAGTSGVVVGRFAWLSSSTVDGDGAPAIVNNTGSGAPSGFVHRSQQALITSYLAESGLTIAPGFSMELMASGDYWARNAGASAVTVGMKAFAVLADGTITFAAAGTTVTGAVETKYTAMSAGLTLEHVKISSQALG